MSNADNQHQASATDPNTPTASPADADDIQPGDLVIVPYPRVREQIGCDAEVGLVLEDRRHVLKVYWPGLDRVFWVERTSLHVVPLDRLPVDPLIASIHRAGQLAHVDLIELYDGTMRNGTVFIFSRGLRAEHVEPIRELLGGHRARIRIEPANMRRLRIRIDLRNEDGSLPEDEGDAFAEVGED